MEKISLSVDRKKKYFQNSFANQYSYLNLKRDSHDKLNSLNTQLQQLRRGSFALPEITTQRKNIMDGLKEKLILLKKKIQQKESEDHTKRYTPIYTENTIMPFPINYSMPIQAPPLPPPMPFPPYPFPFQNHPGCCQECHNHKKKGKKNRKRNKKQKKQEPIKPKQQQKGKKKNKFRIYAYAIYFCIYFRCFSKKFTENRKNWFNDRYRDSERGIIYEGSQKILKKLQQIDFYQIFLQSKANKHITGEQSQIINWQQYTKTALVPDKTSFKKKQSKKQSKSEMLINLTEQMLQKLNEIVSDDEFIKEYHEVFSAGSLDLSFMINNLYLPEETSFLFIHPVKGYLRLSYAEEIQILLIKTLVKIFIFNFLLPVYKVKHWNKRLENVHKLAQYQVQQVWDLTRMVAIYLYIICKQMYIQGVQNLSHNSNFYEVCKKFGIRQAKHLQEVAVSKQDEQQKEKKFELIRNIRNYEIIYDKIIKNNRLMDYKSVIKQKIVDFLSNLHVKLKNEQRQFFKYIKNMTMANPYLIFNNLHKQKSQQQKKDRQLKISNPNQRKKWHQIYGNNSFQTSPKQKTALLTQNRLQSTCSRISKQNTNTNTTTRMGSQYHNSRQKNEKSSNKQNGGVKKVLRSDEMKKAFNIDTVNGKYDENRQDRLRQKFRNYLGKG